MKLSLEGLKEFAEILETVRESIKAGFDQHIANEFTREEAMMLILDEKASLNKLLAQFNINNKK